MEYKVKIAAFEGPLDLLLHLIDKNKIDLYDIPIAELTRQYMDYIEESKEFNIEVATEFLVMAAKLLNIKSKMLLPSNFEILKSDEIVEADEIDPRDELRQHLLIYQKFQRAGQKLNSMLSSEEKFIKRQPLKLSRKILPPQNLSIKKLIRAFKIAITENDEISIPKVLVSPEKFNVKDKISEILLLIKKNGTVKLSELFTSNNASECVAAFLALLELIKRRQVMAEQSMPFSEIIIKNFSK